MRTLLIALVSLLVLGQDTWARTRTERFGTLYGAISTNYVIGSIRYGRASYEFGIYPFGYGFGAVVRSASNNGYISFGLGLLGGAWRDVGPFAGVGYEIPLVSFIELRGELIAAANARGSTASFALVGINLKL